MSILLDTHVWLWWLTGSPRLRAREREAIDHLAIAQIPSIAAISVWEAQMLVSRQRLVPTEPFERWIRRMTAPDIVHVLPLDADVVAALHSLPPTFHGDPADRLIVATARTHALALATHDTAIRKSRLAQIWKP